MKRRTIVRLVLVVIALAIAIAWWQRSAGSLPDRSRLVITCDGKAGEKRFLDSQADSESDGQFRRLSSPEAFVVYRVPIGNSEPERVHFGTSRVGSRLEFSPDGKNWSTVFAVPSDAPANGSADELQRIGCGLAAEAKKQASETGTAYFRFTPADNTRGFYPAVKYLSLDVSGPAPPAHFQRLTAERTLLRFLPSKLMMLVGFGAVLICRRCWKTRWRLFGLGALLWVLSVAAKVGFVLLANEPVVGGLRAVLPPLAADLTFWTYIGLLTGVFECGIFLLIIKPIRRKPWSWSQAASVGIGFGAVEAVAVAIAASVQANLAGDVAFELPGLSAALVGPTERLIALAVHAASVVMIIYAFTRQRWGWFLASFLYKSGIDTVATFVLLSGKDWLSTCPWFVELVLFGPFAYVGLCVLPILWRRWDRHAQTADEHVADSQEAPEPAADRLGQPLRA